MPAFYRLCLVLLCVTVLFLGSLQPCQAADWGPAQLTLQTQAWMKADALSGSLWDFYRGEDDRPSLGVALLDCFTSPDSRLSVSVSSAAWTQIGLSGQLNVAKNVWLNIDCGVVLGKTLRNLVGKTTGAMAGFTYYFD